MSLVAFVAAYPPAEPCGWHVDISGLCRYLAGWSAVAAVIFMATDLFRNEYDLTATAFALAGVVFALRRLMNWWLVRSEEHTSELQALMRISYDVFCLKKIKTKDTDKTSN